jgi:hypothetical protein
MKPSVPLAEVKHLAEASAFYQVCEERDGEDIYRSDSESVDLTHEPHFFSFPPATYC